MSYSDLLDRMKGNDTEAFLEMTDRYGWSVYSAIREKYADPAVADEVYNETMNAVYRSLLNSSAEDPLEALLCTFANHISAERANAAHPVPAVVNKPPKVQIYDLEQPVRESGTSEKRKAGFFYCLGVSLVLIAIAAVLWGIAGLLMDMQLLPFFDLGYSWFNANVMHFF